MQEGGTGPWVGAGFPISWDHVLMLLMSFVDPLLPQPGFTKHPVGYLLAPS